LFMSTTAISKPVFQEVDSTVILPLTCKGVSVPCLDEKKTYLKWKTRQRSIANSLGYDGQGGGYARDAVAGHLLDVVVPGPIDCRKTITIEDNVFNVFGKNRRFRY